MQRTSFLVATSAAVLLLLCVSQVAAVGSGDNEDHVCDHDAPDLSREQQRLLRRSAGVAQSYHPSSSNRLFRAQAARPIRIVFSYEDLTESGAFCTSASGSVPSYRTDGETVSCTANTVLNDTKRAVLRDRIVPAALAKIQATISVEPLTTNLMVQSTTTCGADFTIPESHVSTGVPDADLVVYVASGPIPGSTAAFAGSCQSDQNGRPIVGRMNFDTDRLDWSDTDTTANTARVYIAIHEMMHVLGLTSTTFFDSDASPARTTTAQFRDKTVNLATTPRVQSFIRDFTGCSTLPGAEIEDEQTSGPQGSHWERKLYPDEVMAAVVGTKFSALTLAYLADLEVGYTVDFSVAEQMEFSRNDGCAPHTNKCNTAEGLRDKYFCFDEPTSLPSRCTWDLRAIGRCSTQTYTTALASQFQYFSSPFVGGSAFMDGCPIIIGYTNRQCAVPGTTTESEDIFGHSFSESGRCFEATGIIRTGFSSTQADGPRCLDTQCTSSNVVQFRVTSATSYTSCGAEGTTTNTPAGYDGSVTCPNPTSMCATFDVATPVPPAPTVPPSTTADSSGATPSPPPPTTTPAPSTTPVATSAAGSSPSQVSATVVLVGIGFTQLRADATQWQQLQDALRGDIAAGLALPEVDISISSASVDAAHTLTVTFVVRLQPDLVSAAILRVENWVRDTRIWGRTMDVYHLAVPTAANLAAQSASASSAQTVAVTLAFGLAAALALLGIAA